MKTKHLYGAALGFFLLTFSAGANPVSLVVGTYNFALDGGGGGAEATLNGVSVQIFCDNFANEIYVPSTDSANVTTLGSSENLSETRFGGVSSWTTIDLTSGSTASTDNAFFASAAGSAASARYDMVAYLVSLYKIGNGNNTANNQIQEAIWTLMDPAAYATASPVVTLINPSGTGVPTADLEAAGELVLGWRRDECIPVAVRGRKRRHHDPRGRRGTWRRRIPGTDRVHTGARAARQYLDADRLVRSSWVRSS